MAVTSYTVKRGDSLWKIAKEHPSDIAGNTINAKIDTLVQLNGIKNRNLIYVGQVIKLSESGSSSSSSTSAKSVNPNKVTINALGLQSDSSNGRDVYAFWSWSREHTKEYKVRWEQFKENHIWDTTSTMTNNESTYTADSSASYVQVFVLPIAENKLDAEGNDTGVPWWTAVEVGKQYQFSENPPLAPESAPTCEINGTTLTAKLDNIKAVKLDASYVIFQVIKDNSIAYVTSQPVAITKVTNDYYTVSYSCNVDYGATYKVRAKTRNGKGKESGWSDFSTEVGTKPSAPAEITTYRRNKRTDGTISAYLEWSAVANATKYKIEYTTVKADFETAPSNLSKIETEDARTSIEVTGIESGHDYFFRVKAVNDVGESDPTDIVTIPIGSPPAAPTTWSSASSAFVGEAMDLNWTHNPTDGSRQSYAQLSLKINDNDWVSYVFENTTNDTTGETTNTESFTYGTAVSYKGELHVELNTSHANLKNAKIQWKVRTAGVTDQFSDTDWSVERTIYIYEQPVLNLSMTSDLAGAGALITTLTSLPFYIRATVNLESYTLQKPVGYHLTIVSNGAYTTLDDTGRTKNINAGDAVYSKYFDTSDTLIVEMSANNLDLESGIDYTVYCTADMSTGLTVQQTHDFSVSWTDVAYTINADISLNSDAYTALVTPYCTKKVASGAGGKNLIPYPYTEDTKTVSGITFTVNFDGTITVNGTATANVTFSIQRWKTVSYDAGTYVFSGCPEGSSANTYCINYAVKCDSTTVFDDEVYASGQSFTASSKITSIYGQLYVKSGVTVSNLTFSPQLELGSTATDYEPYYEQYEDGDLVENVTLSVYRREYDGSYTEIATGVPNNYTAVTDPHPSLDYARYRLVAKDTKTGAISFYDMAGYPVGGIAVIIQWEEEWSTFEVESSTSVEKPAWTGSMLKLPYNIDVTDSRGTEVSFIEYAGRKHPVSYYGTQLGETSTWNTDVPKEDKETIYALRRLSLWSGDVYVREPSGIGYWANIEVSFSQKHTDVVVPVTLSITRVEGGA